MGGEKIEMKKHGWVIQDVITGGFVDKRGVVHGPGMKLVTVRNARVYYIRKQARESLDRILGDGIRKVELNKDGRPVKVIPGR